ncbi:PilN domain-containing protein [Thalassomonas actiniarum]|uniref:PilN domain-containing protein n=1 Tax=Thalassomonas actiniarum TaxID=485447 RepID=A0AAE9YQ49_9GAMM|nr:PilN domain-containing protein [Thalassomonas actiniarum]WDD98193.1 PilN domain-containing protein [Thalassomonas actiniarum]
MAIKTAINLLQPELLPPKALLTLNRVLALWTVVLLLMLSWWYSSDYSLTQVKAEVGQLNSQKNKQTKLLEKLEQDITRHKPDPLLLAKLETMKLIVANKQGLHGQLTDASGSYVAGFSGAMTELAKFHSADISLEHISIAGKQISFEGSTRSAQAVPQWLANFEQSSVLSGQVFSDFSLAQDPDQEQHLKFKVSTSATIAAQGDDKSADGVKKASLLSLMGQK